MAIHLSGRLDTKQLARYLKKSRKEHTIRVHRREDGMLLLGDGYILVQTMLTSDLSEFTPSASGLWVYRDEPQPSEITFPDIFSLWKTFNENPVLSTLKATHVLYEIPHYKKPSNLYRKLLDEQGQITWVDRAFLDCFATDPDDLQEFLLEVVQDTYSRLVRVSGPSGILGYLMPARDIQE